MPNGELENMIGKWFRRSVLGAALGLGALGSEGVLDSAGIVGVASRAYAESASISSSPAVDLIKSGEEKHSQGKLEEALKYFDQAIKVDSNNWIAYHDKGTTLSDMSMYKDSIRFLELAVKLSKGREVLPFVNLSRAYAGIQNWERSYEMATEAIKLDPNRGTSYSNRGTALLEIGRRKNTNEKIKYFEQAKSDYELALRLNPNLKSAKEGLEILRQSF